MERLDVSDTFGLLREIGKENASHPAAIYHDIAQGIHRRLSQLEKTPSSCPKCGRVAML